METECWFTEEEGGDAESSGEWEPAMHPRKVQKKKKNKKAAALCNAKEILLSEKRDATGGAAGDVAGAAVVLSGTQSVVLGVAEGAVGMAVAGAELMPTTGEASRKGGARGVEAKVDFDDSGVAADSVAIDGDSDELVERAASEV